MELNFDRPATYRICVKGDLPESWADRLGGMAITHEGEGEAPATILCGRLLDQGALLGVLTGLYSLHLPLLSVERLGDE